MYLPVFVLGHSVKKDLKIWTRVVQIIRSDHAAIMKRKG